MIFHSPSRNNDFKLMPVKVQEGPLCEKIAQEYRQYIMKDLHLVSDLPYSDDNKADLCPEFVKGVSAHGIL